jgi:hypothetical protein
VSFLPYLSFFARHCEERSDEVAALAMTIFLTKRK